ncbi:hypothetical protein O1L60_45575 [Streptomyces diastatochromogenes]|nr:hypothetical protein [Streptomyces diastatochromogenes]
MRNSLSLIPGFTAQVDDLPALRLSPEGIRALPVLTGPRLAVVGRFGPKCRDCRDFESVVTSNGIVTCTNPVHTQPQPQLPMRPTPHERDGRQEPRRSPPARAPRCWSADRRARRHRHHGRHPGPRRQRGAAPRAGGRRGRRPRRRCSRRDRARPSGRLTFPYLDPGG